MPHRHNDQHGADAALLRAVQHTHDHIVQLLEKIMATLDQVLSEVTDESTRLDSIQSLIDGIKQQLADALSGTTLPAPVQARVDEIFTALTANKAKLDKALNANVPAPVV